MTGIPRPAPIDGRHDPDLDDVRAAQADPAAFGTLYRRYLDRVYGYCYYLLGDHHDAEDVTERTFVRALGAIARFRDEGAGFRAWLFRIAHNELANALRSRARRRSAPLDDASVAGPAVEHDPLGMLTREEEARRVRRALADLPEDRRQVLVLRFVDGLSTREIAEVLERSEGAVRVLQHRALRELATRLADDLSSGAV